MSSMLDIERMTIHEYNLRMSASKLKRLDKEYYIHLQAFLNFQVQATDGKNKLIYRDFKQFFNYEKKENEILGIKTKKETKVDSKIIELLKIANK